MRQNEGRLLTSGILQEKETMTLKVVQEHQAVIPPQAQGARSLQPVPEGGTLERAEGAGPPGEQ